MHLIRAHHKPSSQHTTHVQRGNGGGGAGGGNGIRRGRIEVGAGDRAVERRGTG